MSSAPEESWARASFGKAKANEHGSKQSGQSFFFFKHGISLCNLLLLPVTLIQKSMNDVYI